MQNLRSLKWIDVKPFSFIERLNTPEYYWIMRPLFAFLITRLIVFIGAYIAEVAVPSLTGAGLYHVNPNNIFLDVWARWDSSFYINIVENGYFFQPGVQSSVAFFPAYPILVSFLAPFIGTLAAGVVVSNSCLYGALVFLYKLTDLEFNDSAIATRAVFYIAAFPTAFFFSAVYTESTFLMFSIATMYFARRKLWFWAVLFGLITSASRIVGVLHFGVVGLEWMHTHGWTLTTIYKPSAWRDLIKGIKTDWINLLIIFAIPLGLISYMVFLYTSFHDPIAFSTTQSAWGREMLGPITIIWRDLTGLLSQNFLTGDIWYHVIIDLSAAFAVLGSIFWIYRKLGETYAIYSFLSVIIPMWSGTGSVSRYVLVIYPLFMMLALWGRNSILDRFITILFSMFLGIFTVIFVNWIFIA